MKELSIEKRKFFASLARGKERREHGLFTVEGSRGVTEMLLADGSAPEALVATHNWLESHEEIVGELNTAIFSTGKSDMERMSALKSSPDVIAVFRIPSWQLPTIEYLRTNLVIALDDVQDPGNLGTIIRMADWWGISRIITTINSADCFNQKVVQSTMGALCRVQVVKTDSLAGFLSSARNAGIEVFGTFMDGENVFSSHLSSSGVLVMGNEGNGISDSIGSIVSRRLTIPSFPQGAPHVESLNVATATAVILGQFRYGCR